MTIRSMHEMDLNQKRVLIREDLNVPMTDDGRISDDTRIQRALPTIKAALEQGAAVIIMSHLGRPTAGHFDAKFSLAAVAEALSAELNQPVSLLSDWLDGVDVAPGQVVLCENVRFNEGEESCDNALAKKMAALCDVFVMDAFATCHRAHASTCGVADFASIACAGPLLVEELDAFDRTMKSPKRPLLAIVGGAKVSTKIHLLESLIPQVDSLIVGGGIINTVLLAQGFAIGNSLCEQDCVDQAKRLLALAKEHHVEWPMPIDVVVAKEFSETASTEVRLLQDVQSDEQILDIGPQTIAAYETVVGEAETILWNGPVGVFELTPFENGTRQLGLAIANSKAFTVAGGGDTVAALKKFGIADKMSYVSTGGGAFLALLENKPLASLQALEEK